MKLENRARRVLSQTSKMLVDLGEISVEACTAGEDFNPAKLVKLIPGYISTLTESMNLMVEQCRTLDRLESKVNDLLDMQ